MVGVLIRMKLAVLRRSMRGGRSEWTITGAAVGLLLAAGTIALGVVGFDRPTLSIDLLRAALAMWTVGWMVAPGLTGGESVLRADHFSLLPIPSHRLAIGLAARP